MLKFTYLVIILLSSFLGGLIIGTLFTQPFSWLLSAIWGVFTGILCFLVVKDQ